MPSSVAVADMSSSFVGELDVRFAHPERRSLPRKSRHAAIAVQQARGGEFLAQLAPRVVKGLVERTTAAAESLRQYVDRHLIQRQRDEHGPLMVSQNAVDGGLQRAEQLLLLQPLLRRGA